VITPFFKIHTQLGVKGLDIKYTPTHVIAGTEAGVFLAAALLGNVVDSLYRQDCDEKILEHA
jgi:hypothetical protein